MSSEHKRRIAFRRVREHSRARQSRGEELRRYAQWTYWAAIAAIILGVIGVLVTLVEHQ